MMRVVFALLAAGLALTGPAAAFPNGAPWGSADPKGAQSCSSCHFDGDAVMESEALTVSGLPESVTGGETYEIILRFSRAGEGPTGFLVSANSGGFSADHPDMEFKGREIRSISPSRDAAAEWTFNWAAPATLSAPVIFYIGVNAANDDASPFGDKVHFRTFHVRVAD